MSVKFTEIVEDVSAGNKKVLRSKYMENGYLPIIDQGQEQISGYTDDKENAFKSAALPVVIFGDHTKSIKYVDHPFAMGADGVKVLKPNKDCDAKYLYYFLNQANLPDAGYSRHFKFVKRLHIPLPSISEQRRIAAILDKADALRQKRREAVAKLNQLLQSVFLDMFGNPVTNPRGWDCESALCEIADICSGITKGRKLNGKTTVTVPYLAVANVQDQYIKLNPLKTIEATEQEIEKYRLIKNDILLTEGGDPDKLGRGTLWNDEISPCIHQNHIFRVRLKSTKLHPIYLAWQISSSRGKNYFLRSSKQTTGIASINMTQLKNFPVLMPDLALQKKFAEIVSIHHLRINECSIYCDQLDKLFGALQQRAFSGKL